MAKLLHLSCSPRAESVSTAGARVFLDGFRQARPDWDVDLVDIWRERMPEFTGPIVEAKYARMKAQPSTTPNATASPRPSEWRCAFRSPIAC